MANPPRHSFIGIDNILHRREVRERKAREAREGFAATLHEYKSIVDVCHDATVQNPLTWSWVTRHRQELPPTPPAEKRYESTDARELYDSLGEPERKAVERKIRSNLKRIARVTLDTLVTDIISLNNDRGFKGNAATIKAGQIVSGRDRKHPSFWHLNSGAQAMALEDLHEYRTTLLEQNINDYFKIMQVADVEDRIVKKRGDELGSISTEGRASFSLRLRSEVVNALQLSFKVNLNRLAFLLKAQGQDDDVIGRQLSDLTSAFENATLYDKARFILRLQRKKEITALSFVPRLRHLMLVLEEEYVIEEAARESAEEDDITQVLDEESQRRELVDIMSKIRSGLIFHTAHNSSGKSLNEVDVEDLQKEVAELAEKYGDRSLVYAYHIWENLRRDPHDVFEFKLDSFRTIPFVEDEAIDDGDSIPDSE